LAADCRDICKVEDLGSVLKDESPELRGREEEVDVACVLFARDFAAVRKTNPLL
jgi:hypothetical protein